MKISEWKDSVIKQDQIDRYLENGKDFIDDDEIKRHLGSCKSTTLLDLQKIIDKSMSIKTLTPEECATLLNVESDNSEAWDLIFKAAAELKRKVYDNRVVFFAPLYCSNLCVNSCLYCGFREENSEEKRMILDAAKVKAETKSVLNEGHKRLILVFGEHRDSDIDYMEEMIKAVYSVKEKTPISNKPTYIRRVNINAAPMSVEKLRKLKEVGIGTYQVFQETYDRKVYQSVHPPKTLKGDYRWRLYALHRAMEAGVDDVAIGALFGLSDWRFEVMGLLYHTLDLEKRFGFGPHTISFPRITSASGSDLSNNLPNKVSDEDFKKLVAILRLSVPTAGLIVTAREDSELKREVIKLGCTQTDASTKIGIGAYSDEDSCQEEDDSTQFAIGDARDLDTIIRELAEDGYISSFCTAGYRCGRTGDTIMGMLSHCEEAKFCKLNAVLTFREYLIDYASPETAAIGEKVIAKEIDEIISSPYFQERPHLIDNFKKKYSLTLDGDRDLYI